MKEKKLYAILNISIILLTLAITICGAASFNTGHAFNAQNQYGETIKMWGAGVYARNSYFKAPIFIGSDLTVLLLVVPLLTLNFIKSLKAQNAENCIESFCIFCVLLYYSASLAFGVSYNFLHLAYTGLFGMCFFTACFLCARLLALQIQFENRNEKICSFEFSRGMNIFLIISGFSLFAAWLPDIISSLLQKKPLALIEVYTTEITYVLDMGIISPLMFVTFALIKRGKFMGYVFARMIFKLCIIVGVMLPVQTVFQLLAGIFIPLPALISKVFIFVILALFAAFFERRLKKQTKCA